MMYSNFTQQVWYIPQSQRDELRPARFLLQTIPYRFTSFPTVINEGYADVVVNINDFIVKNCIIDYRNINTPIPKETLLENLEDAVGSEMYNELIAKVMDLWSPTSEFLSTLVTTVELMLDPRFNDGTWHCPTCQKRGLDKQRNCPLIEDADHLDPMFKLPFMGETITACPVNKKDETLGRLILEGHNFREINQLPEPGGMGDQPILFVTGTQHLAERLKHFQRQAEEESLRNARN